MGCYGFFSSSIHRHEHGGDRPHRRAGNLMNLFYAVADSVAFSAAAAWETGCSGSVRTDC